MLSKIKDILKSCFCFWKAFVLDADKKEFIRKNQSTLKTQIIILLSSFLVVFVFYSSMKPAVKGACRIILQSDENIMMGGMDKLAGIEARRAIVGTTLREVKSIGTLKANAEVVIKSEIPGKISEILFIEGTSVKKGDELIKFEDDLYKSEKGKSEAEYILKKSEFERVEKLYKQKVGSKKTYDEAFAQMQAAKAQLDSANFQLSRTVIKAPFDGAIGIMKGSVSPGNIVQQQTELVYIVDNSMVRVEFTVPAKYIQDIAVGQSVEITVDAFKDRVFSGTVDAIDSEVDTRNHSILVRAVIPNKNGNLKHGMFSNVKLVTGEKSDVVLVDEYSLDREGAIEFVWIIDDKGRAYRKRVLTGAKDVNGVEILAGLKSGDIVVTTGQLKLTEGCKTKILNKEEFEESGKAEKKDEIQNANSDDEESEPEALIDQKIEDPVVTDERSSSSAETKKEEPKNDDKDNKKSNQNRKSDSLVDKVKKIFSNIFSKKEKVRSGE